jgi:hypothetical protein
VHDILSGSAGTSSLSTSVGWNINRSTKVDIIHTNVKEHPIESAMFKKRQITKLSLAMV